MSDEKQEILICVLWGQHALESVQRKCEVCEQAVAIAAHNIERCEREGISFICVPCVAKIAEKGDEEVNIKGWMVGGVKHGGKINSN